jgi:ribosomal protein L40E
VAIGPTVLRDDQIIGLAYMKCEFCEAENEPNANFCSNCGSPANLQVCPKCEAINESAAVTCVNCGQALEQVTTSDNDEDRTVPPAPAPTEDSDATQPAAEEAKILLQALEEEIKRQRSVRDAEEAVAKSSPPGPQASALAEEPTATKPAQSRRGLSELVLVALLGLVGGAAITASYFLYFAPQTALVGYANNQATDGAVKVLPSPAGAPTSLVGPDATKSASETATNAAAATAIPSVEPGGNLAARDEATSRSEQPAGSTIAIPATAEGTKSAAVSGAAVSSPQADAKGNIAKKSEPRATERREPTASLSSSRSTIPGPGSHLTFAISPSGEIYIDGKHWGTSPPLLALALAPGEHSVEIRSESLAPYRKRIKLQAGETVSIKYRFK